MIKLCAHDRATPVVFAYEAGLVVAGAENPPIRGPAARAGDMIPIIQLRVREPS